MRILFLGTGTSIGVPAIGCDCAVCRSPDPRNRRRRSSLYVEACGLRIVIDTPPDFREQALAFGIRRVDAILYTHSHSDHILGFDDLRRFNQVQQAVIPVYGARSTLDAIERIFPYIHSKAMPGLSYPRVRLQAVDAPFCVGALRILPVEVLHAGIPTYGYRIEAENRAIAYVPDCQMLDRRAREALRGLDLLALDTLRRSAHPTHFSLAESLEVFASLAPARAYMTHVGHDIDHAEASAGLPPGVNIAYDGLSVEL